MRRPELLSPAGSGPAMVAAVQCGADALYLGAGDFNARKSADNFGGELDGAIGYCHARGAKVYVTLNTMVRQDELHRLEPTIMDICRAGADGVIVQDIGVARAIRQMAPDLPLHASTQMAVHNRQGVDFLVDQGFSRVVLAREMEYDEIARCASRGAELEVFIHGALCVSCSGQCLLSSMIGGRSGNRGLCAQPCRMKYRLDDREGYLLSTKDLCGLDGLNRLIEAGADSLKIEGRLKRPEYVSLTTGIYRAALDALCAEPPQRFDIESAKAELRQMFNRGGFTRGYGFGVEDSELMFRRRPNHMGVEIGLCRKNGIIVPEAEVDPKDVLVLRRHGCEDIPVRAGSYGQARRGDRLVRLVSQRQMQDMQERFSGEKKKFPIDARLRLEVGKPARLELSDGLHSLQVEGEVVQQAQNRPADPERIHSQLGKLGDTPFVLRKPDMEIDPMAYLPVSALNALRRLAVEKLIQARMGQSIPCEKMRLPDVQRGERCKPRLLARSADPALLRRALNAGADGAIFSPNDLRAPALDAALGALPEKFDLAVPMVLAETSLDALNRWVNVHADRIERCYLSNIAHLGMCWPGLPVADSALNIANNLSVAQLQDWGVATYLPSPELNRAQIEALSPHRELIVYGRMPLMHLRHCPLRAARDISGKHRDCRRCDGCASADIIDAKALIDRTGAAFPLRRIVTDDGCVIQLCNSAKLMTLRRSLPDSEAWILLLDGDDPVEDVVRLHAAALRGDNFRADAAWSAFESMNATTGHFFRGAE